METVSSGYPVGSVVGSGRHRIEIFTLRSMPGQVNTGSDLKRPGPKWWFSVVW